jgi:hypothetical protein
MESSLSLHRYAFSQRRHNYLRLQLGRIRSVIYPGLMALHDVFVGHKVTVCTRVDSTQPFEEVCYFHPGGDVSADLPTNRATVIIYRYLILLSARTRLAYPIFTRECDIVNELRRLVGRRLGWCLLRCCLLWFSWFLFRVDRLACFRSRHFVNDILVNISSSLATPFRRRLRRCCFSHDVLEVCEVSNVLLIGGVCLC